MRTRRAGSPPERRISGELETTGRTARANPRDPRQIGNVWSDQCSLRLVKAPVEGGIAFRGETYLLTETCDSVAGRHAYLDAGGFRLNGSS
jgi:hypothetical protein